MFYFPILQGHFPDWLPIWGGEDFIFFRPVFNIADAAISVGVVLILIFQKSYFKEETIEEIGPNNEMVEE
ncbi:lipoprotein signal peptidase [compost metagenome]